MAELFDLFGKWGEFWSHSGFDPIEESKENIAITKKLIKIAKELHKSDAVKEARTTQNPILAQQIIRSSLLKWKIYLLLDPFT